MRQFKLQDPLTSTLRSPKCSIQGGEPVAGQAFVHPPQCHLCAPQNGQGSQRTSFQCLYAGFDDVKSLCVCHTISLPLQPVFKAHPLEGIFP